MKSVLISIQPYWVFLIIAKIMGWEIDQEKTVEVRKNFPKALDWNKKSIIYCSKNKQSFNRIPKKYQPFMEKFLGRVVGEFECDEIFTISCYSSDLNARWMNQEQPFTCLTDKEMINYLGNGKEGYAWHITDLVIYDKPKELGEFILPSKIGCCNEEKCRSCKYLDRGNGFNVEDDCNAKFCTDEYKPLRKAPQSWCYVEVLGV
ncbi:MAG: hypothetical protein IJ004_06175 [Clostridia bacterium]|nr:hypothetical protein [Clostridia bacterium]